MSKPNDIGRFILARLVPHVCSVESCGPGFKWRKNHAGCFELLSDDFIEATQMTPYRADGNRLAPD